MAIFLLLWRVYHWQYENNEEKFSILVVISIIWTEELKIFLNIHNLFHLQQTAN
jgi:hypothetical protein